ncbi:MAG: o-succinylbenzoate synthase [Propionibacterium sp.]
MQTLAADVDKGGNRRVRVNEQVQDAGKSGTEHALPAGGVAALSAISLPSSLARAGLDRLLVYRIRLKHRFRRIEVRDGLLVHGAAGWGECSPFWDYDPVESSEWLRAGLEAATQELPRGDRDGIPVNVTVPVVDPAEAAELVRDSGGCTTAKVKVADPRSELRDDCARVEAVRDALGPSGRIRVDANGAWGVEQAISAIRELDAAAGGLEYAEQPCPDVAELAAVRRSVVVPIAADESIRRAEDPLAVARAEAADVIIIKAQPLGGVRRALDLVDRAGLPAVVSSALDSSVGLGVAAHLASALPVLNHACGLATLELFCGDVSSTPLSPEDGTLEVRRAEVDVPIEQDVPEDLCRRWADRLEQMCAVLE